MYICQETPHFLSVVALEQYRARLLHALQFIEDAAAARVTIVPSEVESRLNALVEYVFAGEAEFVAAYARSREHEASYARLEAAHARGEAARAKVDAVLDGLEAEASGLRSDVGRLRAALVDCEVGLPEGVSMHDAAGSLSEYASVYGVGGLPTGWRLGQSFPSVAEVERVPPDEGHHAAADVEMAVQEDVPPTAPAAAPAPAGAGPRAGRAAAPAAPPMAAAAPAAPALSPAALMAMVASLPETGRRRLLGLLPPGWRPGDALPADLLSRNPKELLQSLV
jgi:hypothetical protein